MQLQGLYPTRILSTPFAATALRVGAVDGSRDGPPPAVLAAGASVRQADRSLTLVRAPIMKPAAQRPSGPAAQRPSGPAAQRPSGPAAQRPSGVTCARRQAEARKAASQSSAGARQRPDVRAGRPRRRLPLILLVLALLVGAFGLGHTKPAIAEVLVSNVGEIAGVSDDVHKVATSVSAQGFTTGANAGGYTVTSIDVVFQVAVGTPANLGVELWRAGSDGLPVSKYKNLTVPSSVGTGAVAFAAPAGTTLDANTSYFVLVYRSGSTTGTLRVTGSSSEDSGGHSDWAIADTGHYLDNGTWTTLGTELYGIRVNGAAQQSTSTNANLSALTASTHTSSTGTFTSHPLAPSTFAATTTSYMALVGNAQTHLKLTPTVNASGATVKVGKGTSLATVTSGSASAAIALSLGSNVITVEVTAADGITKKTYTVTVTRRAAGQVWAATFTPEELSWGIGCMSKSECDSQLTQNSFTIGDQSYHFLELAVRDNGSLFFSLSAANLALTNLKFCVGSTAFEFSIFAVQFQFWINSGVTWTAGTPVSLSIGTSCPRQTTTPTQSTDATLSGLKATSSTNATRTFSALGIGTFAAATTSYTVSVTNSVTHVKLTPTVNDSGATVKVGRGTSLTAVASGSASAAIALSVGANAIKVEVTAEDGTTQTYTLTVTRKAATPNAPTRLGVSAGDARLDLGWTAPPGPVTGYDVHYTSASKTGQGAVADDADASGSDASTAWVAVTRSGTAASQAISSLSNGTAYRVRVRATNSGQNGPWAFGTGKPKSRDATLSALTASSSDAADGTFAALDVGTFASGTAAFAATVENAVTHVKLTPTTSGPAATVKVGKGSSLAAVTSGSASGAIPLDVGPNEIKVEVTAGDGTTTRTYTVTVTRAAASSRRDAERPVRTHEHGRLGFRRHAGHWYVRVRDRCLHGDSRERCHACEADADGSATRPRR